MCALVTGVQTCALPIFGTVELVEIARHALLDLGQAPLHLAPREVPVSVIDRLELAAVDRHAGLAQQAEPAAELDHGLRDCQCIDLRARGVAAGPSGLGRDRCRCSRLLLNTARLGCALGSSAAAPGPIAGY